METHDLAYQTYRETDIQKTKAATSPPLLFFLMGIIIFLTVCSLQGFVGNRMVETGVYCLDIHRTTGTDWLTMKLNAGDTLEVQFETVKGLIYMEIQGPDERPLYTGNGKGRTEFVINISESGVYSVSVEAHHAEGAVHILQKETEWKSYMRKTGRILKGK